jgi:hypothetical protein
MRLADVLGLVRRNALAFNHVYELRCNLKRLPRVPPRIGNGLLRLIREPEIEAIEKRLNGLDLDDRRELFARLLFYKRGMHNCYVVEESGTIVYLQWLVLPKENDLLMRHYGRRYRPVAEKHVMIENAFTFPEYRGYGFYPSVSLQLLHAAADEGYELAVTYVRKDNLSSLTHTVQMGFKITSLNKEFKVLGLAWQSWS